MKIKDYLLGMRVGPAGKKGKFYTQVHGDREYNRRKFNRKTKEEIEEAESELEKNVEDNKGKTVDRLV